MDSIEQQIYTNLAFDGPRAGHQTRGRTAGIDQATQARFEDICDRWGVYEPGTEFDHALVQIPLWELTPPPAAPSHYLVILTTHKGRDRQGRAGAVLRHQVRIPAALHAHVEFSPFRVQEQGHLLDRWEPDVPLPDIQLLPQPTGVADLEAIFPEHYPRLRKLLAELLCSGSLRLPVDADSRELDAVFATVMMLAPLRWRQRIALATYAFRNAADYGLVAYRQEDATLRETLDSIDAQPQGDTGALVEQYLTALFDALTARDWSRARSLITGTDLPDTTSPHPRAVHPRLTATGPDGAGDDDEVTTPDPADPTTAVGGGVPTGRPRADHAAPSHHPHWEQAAASGRRHPRKALWMLAPVLLVIVAAVWLLARGGGDGPQDARSATTHFVTLRAEGLVALLDLHEQELGRMLADDTRDLDLREALESGARSLSGRLREATAADLKRLERSLGRPGQGDALTVTQALAGLESWNESLAGQWQRVAVLEELLTAGDPGAVRSRFDPSAQRVSLQPRDGAAPRTPAGEELRAVTRGFVQAAAAIKPTVVAAAPGAALDAWRALDARRALDAWRALAAGLEPALAEIPDGFTVPPALLALQELSRACSDLQTAESGAGLQKLASPVPYAPRALLRGDLKPASDQLATAVRGLEAVGIAPPAAIAAVVRFYTLAADDRVGAPDPAAATSLLTELVAACGQAPTLPCDDPGYGRHLARWRLEAWRTLQGPGSAPGRALLAELGEASLPASADVTARFVDLLDRMVASTPPASAGLIDQVTTAARTEQGLLADICQSWLAANRREAADQRTSFDRIYGRLQASLDRLRAADDEAGPGAFVALQEAANALDRLDMRALRADPIRGGRATAATRLRQQLGSRQYVGISRVDIEVLRRRDYAGQIHAVAEPQLLFSAVQGASRSLLTQFAVPAMAAKSSGSGFAPGTIEKDTNIPLKADDTLLVTGTEPDGAMWFHFYIEPPRQGHIAAALAGLHEVRVSEAARRDATARPDALPPRVREGETIATVRIVLAPGFWAELGRGFGDLP